MKTKVSYVFYYTNGTVKVYHFDNQMHYEFFKHNEGDHVLETKRFYPDEQDEKDYNNA